MISVVVPHHSGLPGKEEMLRRCVDSLVGYDELIIVPNDGTGVAKAYNDGIKQATGEFIVIMADDTILRGGRLSDLADLTAVTVPAVNGIANFICTFCFPLWVLREVGLFDENFVAYYDDDDMCERLKRAGIPIVCKWGVDVLHPEPGHTLHRMPHIAKIREASRQYFIAKWGKEPDPVVIL